MESSLITKDALLLCTAAEERQGLVWDSFRDSIERCHSVDLKWTVITFGTEENCLCFGGFPCPCTCRSCHPKRVFLTFSEPPNFEAQFLFIRKPSWTEGLFLHELRVIRPPINRVFGHNPIWMEGWEPTNEDWSWTRREYLEASRLFRN